MCSALNEVEMLTRSEAEAARLLTVAMHSQGNAEAVARRFAAGWIVSLGPGRYVNRALCTAPTFDRNAITVVIEFFRARGLSPSIQIPGWVAAENELREHGFVPDWSRSLLAGSCDDVVSTSIIEHVRADVGIATVDETNLNAWLGVLAAGNEAPPSMRSVSDEFGRAAHAVPGAIDLLTDLGTEPLACGSVHVVDAVAWLGGAATLPSARGCGLQTTLLAHRIEVARGLGVRFIAATAVPGSVSERNLLRAGLDPVDSQTVWTARC